MPDPNEIVRYCSSLIKTQITNRAFVDSYSKEDEKTSKTMIWLQLAHFSVKEYLISDRVKATFKAPFSKSSARATIVEVYISYIIAIAPHYHAIYSYGKSFEQSFPLSTLHAWGLPRMVKESEEIVIEWAYRLFTAEDALHCWLQISHYAHSHCRTEKGLAHPLYYASLFGFVTIARRLLDGGANVNAVSDETHSFALQAASHEGFTEMVQLLLDRDADVNLQGGTYGNALQGAARGICPHNNIVVQMLLRRGADVNAQGEEHGSALCTASEYGNEDIVQTLLDSGADVNVQGEMYGNALQEAALNGHEDVVRILLDHGADVNAQGGRFDNALRAASVGGCSSIVQVLLDKGANVNQQSESGTALQVSCKLGHVEVVKLLLDCGANVDHHSESGTALQAACGHLEMVQLLLDRGASVNQQTKIGTALYVASEKGLVRVVQLLLDHGANVHHHSERGTALQVACKEGHLEVAQLLLDRGANVDQQTQIGTALHVASEEGHVGVVQLLLDSGADIDQTGKGGHALQIAAKRDHEEIAQLLLKFGADVNASGGVWGGAIEAASGCGRYEVVTTLLEHGANANHRGRWGTAIQFASLIGSESIVELLLEHGADVNAQGGAFGNAIEAATLRKYPKDEWASNYGRTMQQLLQNGAKYSPNVYMYDLLGGIEWLYDREWDIYGEDTHQRRSSIQHSSRKESQNPHSRAMTEWLQSIYKAQNFT